MQHFAMIITFIVLSILFTQADSLLCNVRQTSSRHLLEMTNTNSNPIKVQKFFRSALIASSLAWPGFAYADGIPRTIAPIPEAMKMGEAPEAKSNTVSLADGVRYYDVLLGEGDEAKEGSSVQFLWVLRRSNGYFVDSSANYNNEPYIYRVGNKQKVIVGIDEAIRGMKARGIRRISTPPSASFVEGVDDGKPGPIPSGFGPRRQILTRMDKEVWNWEIKVLKVK